MARRIAAALITLGLFHSGVASALGLGELTLESYLNEPFKANVDLLNTGGLADHQIRIRLATAEDFERLGVDRAYFLTNINFDIEIDDSGTGRILMSSESPVLEPYLDFIIEARWPSGRLLREYTVLVDPPVFKEGASILVSAKAEAIASGDTSKKKSHSSSSGDQVALKKSRLAEGAMPARNFGSNASSAPIAGDKYMIRRDETLWSIAKRAMPAGSSVHQTMLDIQRLNPDAFLGGNINRIKAGYIIYLPTANDLSSDNFAAALAEVRDQNQDWRDGVDSTSSSARSSLRISTESELEASATAAVDIDAGSVASAAGANGESYGDTGQANSDERIGALAQQVVTLERIVSLKDEQIAALQNALAEANAGASAEDSEALADSSSANVSDQVVPEESEQAPAQSEPIVDQVLGSDKTLAQVESAGAVASEPVSETTVKPVATPPSGDNGKPGLFSGWVLYAIGFLLFIVAAAAFVWQRKRDTLQAEEVPVADDVFADIELEDESLELDEQPVEEVLTGELSAATTSVETEFEQDQPPPAGRDAGYGQRKNDQYAADMDTGDALAEADIYIAYGRYPQAVDLLKTAINGEPDNGDYKLKLLQVSADMGEQAEAMTQLAALNALGDAVAIDKAEEYLRQVERKAAADAIPAQQDDEPVDEEESEFEVPELDMIEDEVLHLEDDFGELEIEQPDADTVEDELDLSADFDEEAIELPIDDEEDMIFATDGDAMSTKLDLARAYLDMGDQDGARQIFEEVVAGGTEAQQEEARTLIEQLD